MTDKAVVQGDYVDLRFVKSRKVAQVVLEIPLEAATQFVQTFGTPNPATGVPVAIARLDLAATEEKPKGGSLAQQAGILCGEGAFQKYLGVSNPGYAAEKVRSICNVKGRAYLDHDEVAARKFKELVREYNAWRQAPV